MQLGHVFGGKYRLLRVLGDGGMGTVYEANHEVLGARVAIKVLHEELARKPELVDRFLREARVLAQINNPHVVRVLDIAMAEEGRSAYIVMELLEGESLSALLTRERRLTIPVAADYAIQILDALAAAHALGVVHRDLKPENVFATGSADRRILKVIDFGIAKAGVLAGAGANLTISGALMGTPEYMAPEQAHSADRADARADVYSVGVILYEMLSGARPVDGDDPRVVAMKVERGEVKPLIHRLPEIPRDLAGLVHRAMAPRPELRFASAAEMRQAIVGALADKAPAGSITPAPNTTPTPGVQASITNAPQTTPDPVRGSGTMFGEPSGEVPPQRQGASGTDPGGAPFVPPYANAGYGSPPNASNVPGPRAPYASNPSGGYGAPPARGRRRGAGGMMWVIVGLLVLVGGGAALAFSLGGSSGSTPKKATAPSATGSEVASTDPPPPSPSSSALADDDPIGPLPSDTKPQPHSVVNPVPHGSAPAPSGSHGAPAGSSSAAPSAPPSSPVVQPPFGVPPFSLPAGLPTLPNPFPSPNTSGVGPVITIPTAFPPFQLPQSDPDPPAPSSKPHRPGH